MKFVVLGATRGAGLQIVAQAIERGHGVTAFVRNVESLERFRVCGCGGLHGEVCRAT